MFSRRNTFLPDDVPKISATHNNQRDITANLINALRYTAEGELPRLQLSRQAFSYIGIVEFKRYCKDQASVPKPADSGPESHVTPPRERRNFSRYRPTRKSMSAACSKKMRRVNKKGNSFFETKLKFQKSLH